MLLEDWERVHLNINQKFYFPFKGPKRFEGNLSPSHASFLPKTSDQSIEIAMWFSISERSNNYVSGGYITRPKVPEEWAVGY